MTARLPVHSADAKRDSERLARRRAHAAAFEAATERITRHVAHEVGKPGMRLLEEIADGTKRGPGEMLEQIIEVARDHKAEADAIAPVVVLALRLGYSLVAARQIEPGRLTVSSALEMVVCEAADVVRAAREAIEDGEITDAEKAAVMRQVQELRAAADAVALATERRTANPLAPTLFAAGGAR